MGRSRLFLRHFNHGFTLTELMIATSIVGILSSVAVPGFTRYFYEAKLSEAATHAGAIRRGQAENYNMMQRFASKFSADPSAVNVGEDPSINYRVLNGRFDIIVGSGAIADPTAYSMWMIEERERISQNLAVENNIVGGEFGPKARDVSQAASQDDFVFAVVGDLDGDNHVAMVAGTRNIPLALLCDDINDQVVAGAQTAIENSLLMATQSAGGSSIVPSCDGSEEGEGGNFAPP